MLTKHLTPLGDLEAAALGVLWSSQHALTVHEVRAGLRRRPPLAYTTVLTVLDRLHDKGVVERQKEGRAFAYRPRLTKEHWLGERAAVVLTNGMPASRGALSAFLESVEQIDPEFLSKLFEVVASRRRSRT